MSTEQLDNPAPIKKSNKKKWLYSGVIAFALIILVGAGLWWYQPWQGGLSNQVVEQLRSGQPEVRQQALATLRTWPLMQQQQFVRQWQTTLLTAYEESINVALITGQLQTAQTLLADLQRLYPQLPMVQTAQQEVATYSAQQINNNLTRINQLLDSQEMLLPNSLAELQQAENQLQLLAPNHALLYDSRILYVLLASIDQALAIGNFTLAKQQVAWGLDRYPAEPALLDREVQIQYELRGRPAEVLAECITDGNNCWQISATVPLFSQPWLLQNAAQNAWLSEWHGIGLVQEQFGEYYRQQALQDYNNKQLTLAAVNLLRAAYFTSLNELDKYWEWLAFAFKERDAQEKALLDEAQLSALQHTFLTQIAALDVLDAQRSVAAMQARKVNPQFVQQVAFPMLGDAYLKLAQQLATEQQYQLAIRLLVAGQDFLPPNEQINALLAEYQQVDNTHNNVIPNNFFALTNEPQGPVSLETPAQMVATEPATPTTTVATISGDPCAAQVDKSTANYCQDQLANSTLGPPLIIPPASAEITQTFAISKYPVTINDYNFYCRTTKACKPIIIENPAANKKPATNTKAAQDLPGDFDLSDVQDVMDDYDSYCRTSGQCNSIEPQTQDIPVTNIPLKGALNYAAWLSKQTGYAYRLPNIMEWEYSILANQTHQCSQNTLLGLKKNLLPVQQAVNNAWGMFFELAEMREWVQTPDGVVTIGKEQPEAAPVCILPISHSSQTGQPSADTGFRLVREIR
jgi:hypothetical protein